MALVWESRSPQSTSSETARCSPRPVGLVLPALSHHTAVLASMSRWPSPVGLLAEALMRDGTLQLTGSCDGFTWNAGDIEREQIREYLAAGVFGPASATCDCNCVRSRGLPAVLKHGSSMAYST